MNKSAVKDFIAVAALAATVGAFYVGYSEGYHDGDSAARADYADLVNDCYDKHGRDNYRIPLGQKADPEDLYSCIASTEK